MSYAHRRTKKNIYHYKMIYVCAQHSLHWDLLSPNISIVIGAFSQLVLMWQMIYVFFYSQSIS